MRQGCGFRNEPIQEQRIERKIHEPYHWAIPGTIENLLGVNKFLSEKGLKGYLLGGCLNKKLPRKDIDIALQSPHTIPYCTFGIDWWYLKEGSLIFAKNLNGIVAELDTSTRDYRDKESGLLLPESCINNDINNLLELLYTQEQLKGGEER